MAENTLDNLNDLQFDVLKEIGNIGAGNATTALAKMMNMKIDMNVPRVDLVPFTNLPDISVHRRKCLREYWYSLMGT